MPKKRFVFRVDEEVMRALERWAGDEFRSVNGHLEWLVHRALKEAGRLPRERGNGQKKGGDEGAPKG